MMKRLTILNIFFAISVGLVSFTSACTEKEQMVAIQKTDEAKASYSNQLNFLGHWKNEGRRETFVTDYVREFEFRHQYVKVNLMFPDDLYFNRASEDAEQEFITNILTEPSPEWDIIRINDDYYGVAAYCKDPEWAKKYLVNFYEYEEFRKSTSPELIDQTLKRWQGTIPGPLLEGQYWAIWYNAKVAEKMGITIKPQGMTITDFLQYLDAAKRYNDKNPTEKVTIIHDAGNWTTSFTIGVQLFLSALRNQDEFESGQPSSDKLSAWQRTLEATQKIGQYQPFDPNWQSVDWNGSVNDLPDGKCLFYINGSWMYNIWAKYDAEKVKHCLPAEFPVFAPVKYYPAGYSIIWGVLKNAPHREEAVKFLLEMNKPDMADLWVRYTKCPTGIKGTISEVNFGEDPFENFAANVKSKYGTNIYRIDRKSSYMFGDAFNGVPNHYDEVLFGSMTPDEAMKLIRKAVPIK